MLRVLLLLALAVSPVTAHAQPVRGSHPPRVAIPPPAVVIVAPFVYQPLPYDYYYQRELQKRQHAPPATQSFEGSSPRCARFFCEERK